MLDLQANHLIKKLLPVVKKKEGMELAILLKCPVLFEKSIKKKQNLK